MRARLASVTALACVLGVAACADRDDDDERGGRSVAGICTPFAAQANAAGRVTWSDVPAGQAVMRVWHPSIRAPGNTLSRPVAVGAAGYATMVTIGR